MNSDKTNKKVLYQLELKGTKTLQNEKRLWSPNFEWVGSRLKLLLGCKQGSFLTEKKNFSEGEDKSRRT